MAFRIDIATSRFDVANYTSSRLQLVGTRRWEFH